MSLHTKFSIEEHEAFILDQLLPLIVDYANASKAPTEVVALTCWLSLSTILQSKGFTHSVLMQCLENSRPPSAYETPEGLH